MLAPVIPSMEKLHLYLMLQYSKMANVIDNLPLKNRNKNKAGVVRILAQKEEKLAVCY